MIVAGLATAVATSASSRATVVTALASGGAGAALMMMSLLRYAHRVEQLSNHPHDVVTTHENAVGASNAVAPRG